MNVKDLKTELSKHRDDQEVLLMFYDENGSNFYIDHLFIESQGQFIVIGQEVEEHHPPNRSEQA
jgi:hypothetical protein